MKNNFIIFKFRFFLPLIFAVILIGCEGEIGPAGPQGPQGAIGEMGVAGEDGQNGAENCIDCHGNNQLITAKMFQWENSIHYLGGHYERNDARCAGCHTSQGYLDRIATGAMEASADVEDPLPQNCYTCHQIHQTYTDADWALTTSDPVDIWISGATMDVGRANQCVSCHQPRIPTDGVPEVGQTGDYVITSSRYGPHHGAQGTMFAGVGVAGAYEIGDGYTNSSHTTLVENACITCHMAGIFDGRAAGGHTFRVATEDGEINPNGCVACHTNEDELEADIVATQTEIQTLLDSLGTMLTDIGIRRVDEDRSVPGTYDAVEVGAYYNYIFVVEDQSLGVHNANYARTLLQNSIDALQ